MNKYLAITLLFAISLTLIASRTTTTCDTGDIGHTFDNQKCDNCAHTDCTCTEYNTCESCREDWAPMNDNTGKPTKCFDCSGVGSGVKGCCLRDNMEGVYRATSCDDGYQLMRSGVCIKLNNCKEYDENNICTECDEGYFMDSDHSCNAGVANCKDPGNSTYCKECKDGYYHEFI